MTGSDSPPGGALPLPDNAFLAERTALLFDSLPLALSAILLNGAILCAVQWTAAGAAKVSAWFALTLLLTAARGMIHYRYRREAAATAPGERWFGLFLGGVLVSGVLWGGTAWLLFPAGDPAHRLFTVFILAGMCAGSITTLSASFTAILCFLVPVLGQVFAALLLQDTELGTTMAGMVAVFLAMVTLAGWRTSRLTLDSLRERHHHERAEAAIAFQAGHDSLTGLPNRRLLVERLDQEITRCRRHDYLAAVLFIDIDRFKTINDSLGHAVGDVLLCEIAARLRDNVRNEDTTARFGDDEFVVVLSELGRDEILAARKTRRLAEKLGNSLAEPYPLTGQVLHITAAIGIAMFPVADADADEIVKQADIAMHRAKQLGRGTIQFYLPDMQYNVVQRLELENELRAALARNQMELYFQPQLDADGEPVGAEALLRWHHPERGMVSPAEFIPAAEETGIILPLGEWVLQTACNCLKGWLDAAGPQAAAAFPGVAVNVSPHQFRQPDFCQRVRHVIRNSGVDPRYIELEITESMLVENIEDTARKMEQLSAFGIRLAIDDFGTGYSSLYYLKRLHLHRIKIDQSFVRDVTDDAGSATLVETIILMAQHLGLEVIAEGVETESELRFLRDRGCMTYQGYYFSRPLPQDEYWRYLQGRLPR